MSKFCTNLSRFSSAIFVTIIMLGYAFSASAEEYKSMIRYDRVWECLNLEGSYNQMFIKCMKFDGTEEINGKTYHRLVTFKKSNSSGGGYNIQDDVFKHEGFLREDNGVIYTLMDEYGGRYIPSEEVSDLNTDNITEIALYDFNRKAGDVYEAWTFITGSACKSQFKVISENMIEINGEMCRSLEVSSIDQYTGYPMPAHTFIEGIGAGEYGCLNYHEYNDQPTGMWCCNSINRVFDLDGNVIFKSLDGSMFGDLQYGSFVSGVEAANNAPVVNAPIYDILGRRITAPAPGQLYIQGGKKHIAK